MTHLPERLQSRADVGKQAGDSRISLEEVTLQIPQLLPRHSPSTVQHNVSISFLSFFLYDAAMPKPKRPPHDYDADLRIEPYPAEC